MADRWTYVPTIGVLIMIAWGVPSLAPDSRSIRRLAGALGATAIVGLGAVTHAQIGAWESTETLFRRAIEVTEGNRTAHYNLAWDLARQKRPDESIEHYRRAIAIDPDHFPSQHNLALLLLEQGRSNEAVEPICAALRLADPSDEALRARLIEHLSGTPCP
jgi:tetratricopeptide (TPR) repeat protein